MEDYTKTESSTWNSHLICKNPHKLMSDCLTTNKVYKVINGVITYDNGSKSNSYQSLDDFKEKNYSLKDVFVEVTSGTKVKIIGNTIPQHYYDIGEVVEVLTFIEYSKVYDCISKCGLDQHVSVNDLEVYVEESKFKVGDKVKVIGETIANGGVGKYAEVITELRIDPKHGRYYRVRLNSGREWYVLESDLESVKEEVKVDFKIEEDPLVTYIMFDSVTIAIPNSIPMGITRKHPDDAYDKETGQAIAFKRLMDDANDRGLI